MKAIILTLLLAFTFSAVLREAEAQTVYSGTEISYYSPTNSMYARIDADPDYAVQAYYCVTLYGYVSKNEVHQLLIGGDNYCQWANGCWGGYVCGGSAHAEGFLPYDPSATYTIDSDINVDVYFKYVDESGYETGEHYDYYDFFEFSEWGLIFYPLSFAFTGNGLPRVSSVQNILLGTLTSLFEQGGTSGPPHHLKVIFDHDFERTDMCNQLQKNIQFRVVDFAGRSAGRISIDEKPQNITDTCSNTTVSMTSSCSGQTTTFGNFTDGLRTGCPWNGQANCGHISQNVWRWCRGGPYVPPGPVNLASMTYEVRRSIIRVDGQSDITDGADKFP